MALANIKLKYCIEPLTWAVALMMLFFMDTSKEGVSFCVFRMMGFKSCMGCGIGHAIHDVLHFHFRESLNEHILGIPATLIILYNITKSFFQPKFKTT